MTFILLFDSFLGTVALLVPWARRKMWGLVFTNCGKISGKNFALEEQHVTWATVRSRILGRIACSRRENDNGPPY